MEKQKLYKAISVEELDKIVQSQSENNQLLSEQKAYEDSLNFLKYGNDYLQNRDEECAYILFGRLLKLVEMLQTKYNISFSQRSGQIVDEIERQCQELKQSLSYRYYIESIHHTIDLEELNILMTNYGSQLLIVDMRLEYEYGSTVIDFATVCKFPLLDIEYGGFINFDYLSKDSKTIWDTRKDKSTFVIYTNGTSYMDITRKSMLRHMVDYLSKSQTKPSYFIFPGELNRSLENSAADISYSQIDQTERLVESPRFKSNSNDNIKQDTRQMLGAQKEKLMKELLEIERKIIDNDAKEVEKAKKLLESCQKVQESRVKTNEEFALKMIGLRDNYQQHDNGPPTKMQKF